MSILRPFAEARALLGVASDADANVIKRAYRKLVLAHPPDIDPEGFRRVRDAFELLSLPGPRIQDLMLQPTPTIDPPPLPKPPEPPRVEPLPLVLLRLAAARVDAAALLAGASSNAPARGDEPPPAAAPVRTTEGSRTS